MFFALWLAFGSDLQDRTQGFALSASMEWPDRIMVPTSGELEEYPTQRGRVKSRAPVGVPVPAVPVVAPAKARRFSTKETHFGKVDSDKLLEMVNEIEPKWCDLCLPVLG